MITLYHCVDARSFRALWAPKEVGVSYHLEMLPFPPLKREYLEINPLGRIPMLIDSGTRIMLARIVGIGADVPPRLRASILTAVPPVPLSSAPNRRKRAGPRAPLSGVRHET
jgi:hypothetical protein